MPLDVRATTRLDPPSTRHPPSSMVAVAVMLACALPATATIAQTQDRAPAAGNGVGAPSGGAGDRRAFDIAGGPLERVLGQLGRQAGVTIAIDPSLTDGRRSGGLSGSYPVAEALHRLLREHGLEAVAGPGGGWRLQRAAPLRGELAPVIVVGRNAGAADLPEAYAGGQVARGAQLGMLGNADFMEAPFGMTAYTSEYMRDKAPQRLSDVIGLTDPSVEFDRVNGYAEQISIRGFASAAQDITYGGLYGVLPSMRIYPELAERIEVIKGPTGLLYGMMPDDSVGGTVNIVPKRAGAEPNAQLTATFSSRSHVGVHVDAGRRFGPTQGFGIRFNGMKRSGESEVIGQDKQVGLGTLGLDWVGRGVRVSADLIASRERAKGFGYWGFYGDLAEGGVPRAPDPKRFMNSPDSYYRNQDNSGVFRVEADIGRDWMVYSAVGARSSRFESLANHIDINDLAGNTTDGWYFWKTRSTTTSALTGLRGRFATGAVRHELNVSATGYRDRASDASEAHFDNPFASNIYDLVYSTPPDVSAVRAGPYTPWLRETTRSVAIADTLSMAGGRLRLTLGLRRQWIDSRDLARGEHYKSEATSPAAALAWQLHPSLSLYANYSTGLGSGGIAPADAANAGQVMAPIRTTQREIGLKTDFGEWAATLSLFEIEKPGNGYDTDSNVWGLIGDTRNRGVELTFMGEPLRGLRMLGGIAMNDATYRGEAAGEDAGRRVVGIPRQLAKLGVEVDLRGTGVTLTGGLIHSARQPIRQNNNAYAPAWTRWDAGLRYRTRLAGQALRLRADLQNLTNEAYWLAPAYNGMGAPRTLLLSATVDF